MPTVEFAQRAQNHPVILVELDPAIAEYLEKASVETPPLLIRGDGGGAVEARAHVVAGKHVFALTTVETSNTLLVGERGRNADTISLLPPAQTYVEMSPAATGVFEDAVRRRLASGHRVPRDELLADIPLPAAATRALLRTLGAVEIDDEDGAAVQLLPLAQRAEVLAYVLNSAVLLGQPLDSVDVAAVAAAARADGLDGAEFGERQLERALELVGNVSDGVAALDGDAVAAVFGRWVLQSTPSRPLGEFLAAWERALPAAAALATNLESLKGHYVTSRGVAPDLPTTIQGVSMAQLAAQPRARLEQLFAVSPRWLSSELEPFLSPLAPTKKQLGSILAKFTRTIRRSDGTIVYSPRLS